jgi:hypothetical protein
VLYDAIFCFSFSVFLVVFIFLIVGKTFLLGTAPIILRRNDFSRLPRTLEWLCYLQTYQKTPRIFPCSRLKLAQRQQIFPVWYQSPGLINPPDPVLARCGGAKTACTKTLIALITYTKTLIAYAQPDVTAETPRGTAPDIKPALTLNVVQKKHQLWWAP